MAGWKWWRKLEWHETLPSVAALVLSQDALHLYSPVLQGVVLGLLAAALLVALRRRFLLMVVMCAIALWSTAYMRPAEPRVPWRLMSSLVAAMFGLMLAIGACYRWRNGRDPGPASRT